MKKQQLYTISASGGEPFEISSPGNPVFRHTGSVSVGHLVLREFEFDAVMETIQKLGLSAKIVPMLGQSEEQRLEREAPKDES